MTLPQSVTERYVSNLIHNGRNKEFDITTINRDITELQGRVIGVFYRVCILNPHITEPSVVNKALGVGATIAQAVRHALELHGVTFR